MTQRHVHNCASTKLWQAMTLNVKLDYNAIFLEVKKAFPPWLWIMEKLTFTGPHLNNHLIANEIKPGKWHYFGANTDFKEQTTKGQTCPSRAWTKSVGNLF